MAGERAVLVYDGECPMCAGAAAWIARRAVPGGFELLPCQSPERLRRFPALPENACLEAMQLVLPDGRILAGAGALPEILGRLRGWGWLVAAFRLPGVGRAAPVVYRWVARHRHAISRGVAPVDRPEGKEQGPPRASSSP
jgi:predicted DCC family thiol-disulfide oxidoreductase YuxK